MVLVRSAISMLLLLLISFHSSAQWVRWDGEANNGLWNDPLNWNTNLVPTSTDSVLLDNSIVPVSYSLKMPEGNTLVRILRLCIRPDQPNTIVVEWPFTNTAASGLWVQGAGGIQLYANATFINASGASPGTAILISDSLYIFQGGRWIHRTTSGHASYLSRLSKAPDTDSGVFEFDVPGPGGYAVSITGRQFGTLELNNSTGSSSRTYFSNGIQPCSIRGDLIIRPKVNFSLDYNSQLTVQGDLICDGLIDLATGLNAATISLKGGFMGVGSITETGSVDPLIDLSGSGLQDIDFSGQVSNTIKFQINNPAGVRLNRSIMLPYQLKLINGKFYSSNEDLLTIGSGGTIIADSIQANSFINGPVKKMGLNAMQSFLFPVGKGSRLRWVHISSVTGDVKVEYMREDPHGLAAIIDSPLKHISGLEYWKLEFYQPGNAKAILSFDDVNSGGVTELSSLTTAFLENESWRSAGNTAVIGSAGASGAVQSMVLNIQSGVYAFCLGSINGFQNPLPLRRLYKIRLQWDRAKSSIKWVCPVALKKYEIKWNTQLYKNDSIGLPGSKVWDGWTGSFKIQPPINNTSFEMLGWDQNGIMYKSDHLFIPGQKTQVEILSLTMDPSGDKIKLNLKCHKQQRGLFIIADHTGRVVQKSIASLREDVEQLTIPLKHFSGRILLVTLITDSNQIVAKQLFRF